MNKIINKQYHYRGEQLYNTGGNRDNIDTPSIHSGPGTAIIDRDKLVLWELNTLLVNGCGHASVFYMGVVMPTLTYNWVSSVVVMNTEP